MYGRRPGPTLETRSTNLAMGGCSLERRHGSGNNLMYIYLFFSTDKCLSKKRTIHQQLLTRMKPHGFSATPTAESNLPHQFHMPTLKASERRKEQSPKLSILHCANRDMVSTLESLEALPTPPPLLFISPIALVHSARHPRPSLLFANCRRHLPLRSQSPINPPSGPSRDSVRVPLPGTEHSTESNSSKETGPGRYLPSPT